MGARIEGAGEETIAIEGVDRLGGAEPRDDPRPHRGRHLPARRRADRRRRHPRRAPRPPTWRRCSRCSPSAAPRSRSTRDGIRVRGDGALRARDVETAPHPGLPHRPAGPVPGADDPGARGRDASRETVFENRFQHAAELVRMGADIRVEGAHARGPRPAPLSGAAVMATDLRASACLVLAGVAAERRDGGRPHLPSRPRLRGDGTKAAAPGRARWSGEEMERPMTDCVFCRIAAGQIPARWRTRTRRSWPSTTSIRRPRPTCWSFRAATSPPCSRPATTTRRCSDGCRRGGGAGPQARPRPRRLSAGANCLAGAGQSVFHLHLTCSGAAASPGRPG